MKKPLCLIIAALLLMISAYPALAATYNANTSIYIYLKAGDNNAQFSGSYHWTQSYPPINSVTIVNNNFSANCNIKIDWYDSSNNVISTSNANSNGNNTINGPAGNTHFAIYGSCSDSSTPSPQPYSYILSETDSQGNVLIFDAPAPPSGGGGTVDLTPIVGALQTIQGQLNDIKGELSSLGSGGVPGGDISDIVDAIQDQTSDITGEISSMSSQLSGKLTTINSKLQDIYGYISTPRTSQPLTVNMPETTFDPTPPVVSEPYQQPYKYDKPPAQTQPFADSPGPLPMPPDPWTMEHDPAANIEQPKQIDPVIKDTPRAQDPVNIDAPIPQDPVIKDTPRAPDPVIKDTPRTPDPVATETPRVINVPIQPAQPAGRDNPVTPAAPIAPTPPK